jgi:hypothetical protein
MSDDFASAWHTREEVKALCNMALKRETGFCYIIADPAKEEALVTYLEQPTLQFPYARPETCLPVKNAIECAVKDSWCAFIDQERTPCVVTGIESAIIDLEAIARTGNITPAYAREAFWTQATFMRETLHDTRCPRALLITKKSYNLLCTRAGDLFSWRTGVLNAKEYS